MGQGKQNTWASRRGLLWRQSKGSGQELGSIYGILIGMGERGSELDNIFT